MKILIVFIAANDILINHNTLTTILELKIPIKSIISSILNHFNMIIIKIRWEKLMLLLLIFYFFLCFLCIMIHFQYFIKSIIFLIIFRIAFFMIMNHIWGRSLSISLIILIKVCCFIICLRWIYNIIKLYIVYFGYVFLFLIIYIRSISFKQIKVTGSNKS